MEYSWWNISIFIRIIGIIFWLNWDDIIMNWPIIFVMRWRTIGQNMIYPIKQPDYLMRKNYGKRLKIPQNGMNVSIEPIQGMRAGNFMRKREAEMSSKPQKMKRMAPIMSPRLRGPTIQPHQSPALHPNPLYTH